MIKHGPSQIINKDEELDVIREGTRVPDDVAYKDGKAVAVEPFCFKVTCNVQPFSGRDLLLVPELDRTKEWYWLFTNNCDIPIQVQDRVNRRNEQTDATIVSYQVQSVQNWGSHQEVKMCRIDIGKYASDNQTN